MSLLELVPAVGVAAVGGLLLAAPALRLSGLVTVVILGRTVSDIGSASTNGAVLPATSLNAVLAGLLLVFTIGPARERLPAPLRRVLLGLVMLLLAGATVGLLRFGPQAGSLQEVLRLVSVVAVFVVACRLPPDDLTVRRQLALLGVVPAAVVLVGVALSVPATLLSNGRAAGGFSHANAAAAYFAIAALACLGWWLRDRDPMLAVASLLSLVALGFTESLGGLAGFATAALVLVLLSSRLSPRRVGPLVALLVVVWIVVSVTGVGERVNKVFQGVSASDNGDSLAWRFLNWQLLLNRWREHPWLGFGLGSTRSEIAPLSAPPHSLPVQVLVETGVVGLVAVTVMLLVLLGLVLTRIRARRTAAVFAISLLLLVVVNGVESNLLNYTPALYLLALVLGRLYAARDRPGRPPAPAAGDRTPLPEVGERQSTTAVVGSGQ